MYYLRILIPNRSIRNFLTKGVYPTCLEIIGFPNNTTSLSIGQEAIAIKLSSSSNFKKIDFKFFEGSYDNKLLDYLINQ